MSWSQPDAGPGRSAIRLLMAWAVMAAASQCSREPPPPAIVAPPAIKLPDSYRELQPGETEALMRDQPGLVILDFRTEQEWADEGHLPRAQLVNFFRDKLRDHLAAQDRGKSYLLCCAIGERSRIAAGHMAELGFAKVSLLAGGMNAWKASGKPVER